MHYQAQPNPRQSASKLYKRAPSGLLLPIHANLAGRVRWQTLDERGVPEIPRNPSGFAIGPIEGIEQPNLITNLGMDRIGTAYPFRTTTNTVQSHFRLRLAVGTGSVAPDVADTTLDAEVQRDVDSGTFGDGALDGGLDTDTNEWWTTVLVRRLVTMTADRNLTEFGFSESATANTNIHIRELFRDGVGTPVTVSLLNGKIIRVDHTLEARIAAPAAGHATTINIEEYDAANALVATLPYDVVYGFAMSSPVTVAKIINTSGFGQTTASLFGLWAPNSAGAALGVRRMTLARSYARLATLADYDPTNSNSELSGGTTAEAYTPGSFTRTRRMTVPAGSGNDAWYGVAMTSVGSFSNPTTDPRFEIIFDNPATYTKVDTDTMRFGIVSTWARA